MLWSLTFATGGDLSGGGRAAGVPAACGLSSLATANAASVMLAGFILTHSDVRWFEDGFHSIQAEHECPAVT